MKTILNTGEKSLALNLDAKTYGTFAEICASTCWKGFPSQRSEKERINPTLFYQWQKTFFENGAAAFTRQPHSRFVGKTEPTIAALENKLKRKDEVIAEIMSEHIQLKKELGGKLTVNWVAHDIRDQVVDFVLHWSDRAELPAKRLLGWIELSPRQYHRWQERFGKVNEHNHLVPRDHWLEAWEKVAVVNFAREYPLEGYRRLTFMMLDRNIVAVSPASVYRVMREAGLSLRLLAGQTGILDAVRYYVDISSKCRTHKARSSSLTPLGYSRQIRALP